MPFASNVLPASDKMIDASGITCADMTVSVSRRIK